MASPDGIPSDQNNRGEKMIIMKGESGYLDIRTIFLEEGGKKSYNLFVYLEEITN